MQHEIAPALVLIIAGESHCDPRTVRRVLRGERVKRVPLTSDVYKRGVARVRRGAGGSAPMPTTIAHRSPFNVPRWTETQAREVIAALDRSGKPVSVFAAEHALDPQRIYQGRRSPPQTRRNRSRRTHPV